MCIKAVEVHRVIEPEHSNWMRPYIMLSISLRKDTKNEFEKVWKFESFWKDDGKYQENVVKPKL